MPAQGHFRDTENREQIVSKQRAAGARRRSSAPFRLRQRELRELRTERQRASIAAGRCGVRREM